MKDMKKIITICVILLTAVSLQAQKPAAGDVQDTKTTKEDHSFSVAKNLEVFNAIYRNLDLFYVDTLDANHVIQTGIDAMLSSLDPYTEYFADEDMGDLKMMTTGKYGGIGAIIRMRKDSTVCIGQPYAGMPAAEVGLKVGDVLRWIDDTDLKGKTVSDVSDMLRGEPGTTFVLKVLRPGEKKERSFKITRRNIKISAMPYAGILPDASVGYIDLTQFTEGCSMDIRKAVISLKEKGATSLILDLRGNGGGLLSEAVSIVNLFVPKGLKIVETKGKIQAANMVYTTTAEPLDTVIPLCVLVNGSTASAAEIVSGSLQDLDRAIVLGTRTYGKGLVQSPRELPFNGSLKLTTSKYYIPSGRCIQAINYKNKRELGDDGRVPDSLANVFHTKGGREVRDGGGIKPDIEIMRDTMANVVFYLSNDDVLLDWGTAYMQQHPTLPAIADFRITDADFADLKRMAHDSGFKYDRLSEKNLEDLKKMMKFEGYYDDAEAEFEALAKKLEHNMDRDFDKFRDDITKLMASEVIKRQYFEAGMVEEALKGDSDVERAVEILKNRDEYKKVLGK